MMPVKMLDNVPYLTWLSSLSGLNKVPQGMAGSVGNVVMPTPHKILPGVVPLAGHGYDVNELMHMQKLLVNAADTSGTKEEKEQALAAAKIIQQQVLSVKAIQASADNSSKVPTTSSPPTSSLGSFRKQSAFVSTQVAKEKGDAQKVKVKVERERKPRRSNGSGNSNSGESQTQSRTSPMVTERASDSSGTQGSDGSGSADNMRQLAPKSPSPQEQSLKKEVSPPLTSGNGNSNGSSGNGSYGNGYTSKEANANGNEQQGSGSDHSNEQQNNNGTSNNQAESHLMQILPKITDPQWANSYQQFCSMYSNAQFGPLMFEAQRAQFLKGNQFLPMPDLNACNLLKAQMKAFQDQQKQLRQQQQQQQQLMNKAAGKRDAKRGANFGLANGKTSKDVKSSKAKLTRNNSGFVPYVKKA